MKATTFSTLRKLHADTFGYVERTKPGQLTDAPNGGQFIQWNSANTEIVTDVLDTIRKRGVELVEIESPRPGTSYKMVNDPDFALVHVNANAETRHVCVWLSKH